MGVVLDHSDYGKSRLSLQAFHILLGRGLFALEWGGGGMNTLLNPQKRTFNLGIGQVLGGKRNSVTPSKSSPHTSMRHIAPLSLTMLNT